MISYEISLGSVILAVLVVARTLNFSAIIDSQKTV
jgi:NADH:ubiquinone oxidoreductase subunit H